MSINAYKQQAAHLSPKDLSEKTLHSIELYMKDLLNTNLSWGERCEAGLSAMTLVQELSNNLRADIPRAEQEILIKVFGQIIKNLNRCMRGEQQDLSKELAGVKLIRKLIM